MKYLFLLTITPVQDFISHARKLKDLYGGSHILSEMSRVGIEYAQNKGAVVIFPQKVEGTNSYPNRFLIEISFENEEKLKAFANGVSDEVLGYFRKKSKSPMISQHIEDFFQIYWSASEYSGDYKEAYDKVEKRLAGAKNSRFFTQLGEVGRKCSICGERNIAVYKKPMRFYIEEQRKNLVEAKKSDNLQHGEGLCGVCYIKRITEVESFNSTADISIMNIPLNTREKQNYLQNDSQLFYEENLNQSYFDKNDIGYPLIECQKEHKEFTKEIKDKYKQTSYYAVVMFDGDDMGKWLSGQKLNDMSKLKEFHKDISLNLATFAKKAKEILQEPKGMTVYAGGEDFLGFVNINNLFEVIKELNSEFTNLIGQPLQKKYSITDNFTFSAGVVIAHYKTPLGTVLSEARKSEKKAKKNSGKDSVCLTVLKRSGEVRETVLKFNEFINLEVITEQLKDNFSDSFMANLETEFLLMCDENGELDNSLDSLVYDELDRLLKRSLKNSSVDIDSMKEAIIKTHSINFRNFVNGLYICRFINKEIG